MKDDEIKEILDKLRETADYPKLNYSSYDKSYNETIDNVAMIKSFACKQLLDYITNLQQENKIKDTNWESLKYYLEKLYYRDYIEEAISDDIDKKIKELESKVEIKGYQKDIKALQQENEDNLKCIKSLKEQLESVINENQRLLKQWFEDNDKTVKLVSEKECYKQNFNDYKSRCEEAIEYLKQTSGNYKNLRYEPIKVITLINILNGRSDE